MQDKIFIDSNIWLYAFMNGDIAKKNVALKVISNNNVILSTQVLNEISINLIKKANYNEDDVYKLVENIYEKYNVICIDKSIILNSLYIKKHYSISFWDSLIVAAAISVNADVLYSEDMHSELIIENKLKIINPFDEIL